MEKILLLGGSFQQIAAIKKAKELGLYVIVCDYLVDNPGQRFADEYHQVSTTNKEAILKVALENKIDYIFAYASDPAVPTAAYVSEKMALNGNPYNAVITLSEKDRFRDFLMKNQFILCSVINIVII
jgi:formate-dependent phosphoribosylglycinamide formyltransferase (GAR transformylase)